MLYLYDNAICTNLSESFNQDEDIGNVVKVIPPEEVFSIVAQVQEDKLRFPLVALTREPDYQLDKQRLNFTAMKRGVQSVMDVETNMIYNERVIPITLDYSLTVLATNTADMDEITRELLFKYTSMYFLSIDLPYEASRKIRFGIIVDREKSIERSSSQGEYLSKGQLYQTIIPLHCEGAVLLHYVPFHLKRIEPVYELVTPTPKIVFEPSTIRNPDNSIGEPSEYLHEGD